MKTLSILQIQNGQMNKLDRVKLISSYFDEILPNAKCELEYSKPYELVIAVMLSSQTTDKSVNKVTRVLFSKYPTLKMLANAKVEDIFEIIKTLGLASTKAKNVKGIALELLEKYNGEVPHNFSYLVSLPGVGRKTSNVILAELFNEPVIAVDTHVERVSKRLYLASEKDNVIQVENKLMRIFPQDKHVLTHHQMIHFGRYFCKSQNPKCAECRLTSICRYFKNK